jgi:hypothetical protein
VNSTRPILKQRFVKSAAIPSISKDNETPSLQSATYMPTLIYQGEEKTGGFLQEKSRKKGCLNLNHRHEI